MSKYFKSNKSLPVKTVPTSVLYEVPYFGRKVYLGQIGYEVFLAGIVGGAFAAVPGSIIKWETATATIDSCPWPHPIKK